MYIIPYWMLNDDQRREFRRHAVDYALTRAQQVLCASKEILEINDLSPGNLGLKDWYTPPLKGGELTPWIDYQVKPEIVMVIYKVTQLEMRPKIDRLRIEEGHQGRFYELSQLYIYGHEGYFVAPHLIGGHLQVSIGTDRTVKKGQKFLLNGFVVKRSLL
jgi:hypothetical protein